MNSIKTNIVVLAMLMAGCSRASANTQDTDWVLLGNGTQMQHHADLAQINKDNIAKLGLAWAVEMPITYGLVGNPLIQNGVVFQGGPGGRIFANDLAAGKLFWNFTAQFPENAPHDQSFAAYMGRQVNRGLALYKDKAIIATGDCRLVAVDQKTGQQRWETQSCDPKQQYGISAAPRVGDGLVFIGNSCADSGEARGFVD